MQMNRKMFEIAIETVIALAKKGDGCFRLKCAEKSSREFAFLAADCAGSL